MTAMSRFEPSGAHRMGEIVEAEFLTLKRAEEALNALEWAGFDAANITLAGPSVRIALARTDTEARDARLARKVAGTAIFGFVTGAVVGLFAGGITALILGSTMWNAEGHDRWLVTGLGALLGMLAFAVIGAVIGGEVALNISMAAELAYEDVPPEPAIVQVSVTDPMLENRAQSILRDKHPLHMWRMMNGRMVPAA